MNQGEKLLGLRSKLKKADVLLNSVGFYLRSDTYMGYYSVRRLQDLHYKKDDYDSWISIRLHINYINDVGEERLDFICEPCTMSGGDNYLPLEGAKRIIKYWTKLIKVCETLNDMNIQGSRQDILFCLEDINRRKRK